MPAKSSSEIIKEFPERKDLEEQSQQLRQLGARTVLKEIRLRGSGRATSTGGELLDQFPTEGVAGETLEEVRELLANTRPRSSGGTGARRSWRKQVAAISRRQQPAAGRRTSPRKSRTEINEDAIGRLVSFERLADDEKLTPEQKVALAISGWLVGANQATDNFHLAVSLAQVRDKIRGLFARAAGRQPPATGERAARHGRRRRSSAWRKSSS